MGKSLDRVGTITAGSSVSHQLPPLKSNWPHPFDRISVEIGQSPKIEAAIAAEWAAEQNEKPEHNTVGRAA
jgi:hypothetical protein